MEISVVNGPSVAYWNSQVSLTLMTFSRGTCKLIFVVTLLFSTARVGMAQEQPPPKKTDNAPTRLTGAQMFHSYCAPCHGKDAKGNGPLAPALKVPPPDLTTLSKRGNGKFPADYIATVVKNGANVLAHGSAEMPVWGTTFADYKTHQIVTLRISDLTSYLESLQSK
jgi:mono/diheme cytochrome c family protein